MQELVIDIPANEWLSANDRYTPLERARRVAELRLRAAWMARSTQIRRETGRVRIEAVIHGRAKRRSDPNNAADTTKPLVDGLRDAGVLVDDHFGLVVGPDHTHGEPIKELPVGWRRVRLIITPIEEEGEGR